MARKTRTTRNRKARNLDLAIKVRTKSIVSLEWGCAYSFPMPAAVAVPLIVVSELYALSIGHADASASAPREVKGARASF